MTGAGLEWLHPPCARLNRIGQGKLKRYLRGEAAPNELSRGDDIQAPRQPPAVSRADQRGQHHPAGHSRAGRLLLLSDGLPNDQGMEDVRQAVTEASLQGTPPSPEI